MNLPIPTLFSVIEKYDSDVQFSESYGEKGYTNPEKGIFYANWNHVPNFIFEWLNSHGYEIEWSDEWIIDYESSKGYRTSPDSYGWTPSYWMNEDGEIFGIDDIAEDESIREFYSQHLINNDKNLDRLDIDWSKDGWTKVENQKFEHGFYAGQTDTPQNALKMLKELYPNNDFIFQQSWQGQFDIKWIAWRRQKESDAT